MTPDESFERFWATAPPLSDENIEKVIAKAAWLAATRATALQCVEICRKNYGVSMSHDFGVGGCVEAIKQEFGL